MADDDLPTTAEEHVVDEQPQTDAGPLGPTSSESPVESRRQRLGRYTRVTKSRADALRSQAADRIDRLEADRERRPLVDVVFAIRDEDEAMGGRELAAAIAYRLFFLSLPLILIFVGGLGLTGGVGPRQRRGRGAQLGHQRRRRAVDRQCDCRPLGLRAPRSCSGSASSAPTSRRADC